MLKILTFTTLYPNAARPHHGVFVENRLRHLVGSGEVEARVVAPVPWFPLKSRLFGSYAEFARAPGSEERHGLSIEHPRYPLLPKMSMSFAPWSLSRFTRRRIARLREEFPFDLIDAHYFFPDGVAAIRLGERLGVPVTITARGVDVSLIPRYRAPRRMILRAAEKAAGIVTVCRALKDALVDLGVDPSRVRVLRNGVDLDLFRPADRAGARERLSLERATLLSVGHLVPRKGHDLVIRALGELPGHDLLIAGDGPEEAALRALAASIGVENRVRFLGRLPHETLPELYTAADVLVLASSREGWANVLLEAMACGTPVVATDVWGTPEVVTRRNAGLLVSRSAEAISGAVAELLSDPPERTATRAYAEGFGWEETTRGQLELFSEVLSTRS